MGNVFNCGVDGDETAKEVMRKFKVYTVGTVKPGPLPQLVTGRVAPASHNLCSPIETKPCVYYHVEAQTLDKADGNGKEKWSKVFEESQCVDFVLADPSFPEDCCAIRGGKGPNTSSTIRVHTVADGSYAQKGNRLDDLWVTGASDSPAIKALAQRHQFELNESGAGFLGLRSTPKKMRYFEYSFDINEQIVLLGIVTERVGPDNKTMKFITPCNDETLTADYFKTYGWSEHSQQSWHSLFKNRPAILASDDDIYFQGIKVDPFDADTVPEVLSS
jgi:hypothetical protein